MRPTMGEICECIRYILKNEILPELTSSFAKAQATILDVVIAQIAATCKATMQFPLIKENQDLMAVLQSAGTTFKAIKPDYWNESLARLTQKIEAELQNKRSFEEEYPTCKSLEEENDNLTEILDHIILALGETMQYHKSQAMDELRHRIRAHLRKHLNRQLSAVSFAERPQVEQPRAAT